MPNHDNPNRREFLERLGAGAILGATGFCGARARAASTQAAWAPPPALQSPNILLIMVDQMRLPMWMSADQVASLPQVLPNICGRLQNNSYNFGQYFIAATVCTPSRAALLTGLYAPQTAMYGTAANAGGLGTALNPAFPTWGRAIAALNSAYAGNAWWFGKWHLSDELNSVPLSQYGFNTRTYPGGQTPPYNPSPDGAPNEGTDGGLFGNQVWANDSMIANDFIGWLQGQAPTSPAPSSPWCAAVSFVNPHDITQAPSWLLSSSYPPPYPHPPVYFPPPVELSSPPLFYNSNPALWNWEDLPNVANKPSLQVAYYNYVNSRLGTISLAQMQLLLNQYMLLQSYVDQQVGAVLDALASSPYANNTVVLFLSDHGEYAGSHGMHTKGFAVYDESIRVPFYVQFPGQTGSIAMNQMCSAVDVFGLICDLATAGSGQWMLAYPDLANRQSLWSFLYKNSSETRVAPGPVGIPFVLHTCDEGNNVFAYSHITCMRTKLDLNAGAVGAKLACYANWASCSVYPDNSAPQMEFYDYNPATSNNTAETGNDFNSPNGTTLNTLAQYQRVFGTWGPPGTGTGIIGSELNAPLIGVGTDGNPLNQAQAVAQQAYLNWLGSNSGCSNSKSNALGELHKM